MGKNPADLESDPAEHRVKRFSPARFIKNLLRSSRNSQSYEYPKQGIGQISEALLSRYISSGGQIVYNANVNSLAIRDLAIQEVRYTIGQTGKEESAPIHSLVSTASLPAFSRLIRKAQKNESSSLTSLEWRGLRLLFVQLPEAPGAHHETFYIPDTRFLIGRVSEPNLYSPGLNPGPQRILTLEIPCDTGGVVWSQPKEDLIQHCLGELSALGITPKKHHLSEIEYFDVKVPQVYPIYKRGWRQAFEEDYKPVKDLINAYSIGRSALFLHCNIDHCIVMAHRLAEHLTHPEASARSWHNQVLPEFFGYKVRD
jgi:protoporphyrinogen oxidase